MEPLPRICIFAKPPVPGQVKTRLAEALGAETAAELAKAFLFDTVAAVRALGWARIVIATTGPMATPEGAELWLQGDGDLGARIERILRRALADAPFAIAIGADAPALPAALLEAAREALVQGHPTLGPAEDGGFYLLGLRRCPPGLLADLPWSSSDTCARTLERLRERGLSPRVLAPWFDVDRGEDLDRLHVALARGEIRAPETGRALAKLAR